MINKSGNYDKLITAPEINLSLEEFLKVQKRYPVIAVTGPAGVGKSTIANNISQYLGAKLFTELPETNPCLKIIKETKGKVNDITLWGNNQNFFLATDVAEVIKAFITSKEFPVVFDFALTQPFIFSDINLKGSWLKTFNEMFNHQFDSLPKPDIVLEIQADDSVIIDRLAKRGTHIDDFVIKMTQKINSYYKNGIVSENYDTENTNVIQFYNNKQTETKSEFLILNSKIIDILKNIS